MAVECQKTFLRVTILIAGIAVALCSAESDDSLPNWVSPINASESACYRKTYLSSKTCATGYESDGIATCWAQCPLNYPVECGMECIPQSSDCSSQIMSKVKSLCTATCTKEISLLLKLTAFVRLTDNLNATFERRSLKLLGHVEQAPKFYF
ncbi:unnamed protein product [Phytophthora lilii]|uniref:Unnamed protein product n=1 Tax=Phytophthora lilii TaxID=2077276 RepID=A0A9W6YKI7_9STRA|nr:unnamed protein product [Phytophthora lilii]